MARPVKTDDEKLARTVAFRLTESDYNAYRRKFTASGMKQSEFFREHVLNNTTQVVARPTASSDTKRAVFLLQKSSNNINQLAHRANSEHLAGRLNEGTFRSILDQLERLNRVMLDLVAETKQ